jgi:hypothetical protein
MSRRVNTRVVSDIETGRILKRIGYKYGGPWAALMGVRFPSQASNAILNQPIVTTAQTICCITPPINLPLDFALVLILWYYVVTLGASTNSVTVRIHRGTTTAGAVLNTPTNFAATASTIVSSSGCYFDTPGAVANQQYSLDIAQVGATGNATVNDVAMLAFVL